MDPLGRAASFIWAVAAGVLLLAGTALLTGDHLPPQRPIVETPPTGRSYADTGTRSLHGPADAPVPGTCGEYANGTPVTAGVSVTQGGPPGSTIQSDEELLIVVDVAQLRLTLLVNGEVEAEYPVAIGKWTTPTPVGEFIIVNKSYAPGGPFGAAWMGLNVPWGSYGIHGTNQPGSIGYSASAGCIRMHNHHVRQLFQRVPLKTPVIIKGVEPFAAVTRPLRSGMIGEDVQYVQYRLRESGFDPGSLDGRFGRGTEQAVMRLQMFYDLNVTGVVAEDELYVLGIR